MNLLNITTYLNTYLKNNIWALQLNVYVRDAKLYSNVCLWITLIYN